MAKCVAGWVEVGGLALSAARCWPVEGRLGCFESETVATASSCGQVYVLLSGPSMGALRQLARYAKCLVVIASRVVSLASRLGWGAKCFATRCQNIVDRQKER